VVRMRALALLLAVSASSITGALPAAGAGSNPLIGSWKRTVSCTAFLSAMRNAGITETVQKEWLANVGAFDPAQPGDVDTQCKNAPHVKHSHFFTKTGKFGSRDPNGTLADTGDYRVVGPHSLSFPSHAREFGYPIKVRYRISAGKLRFTVLVPRSCSENCQEANAWALSAFYPGPPFTRGR